jgi:hypothetical protein
MLSVALHMAHLVDVSVLQNFQNLTVAIGRESNKLPPPIRPIFLINHNLSFSAYAAKASLNWNW